MLQGCELSPNGLQWKFTLSDLFGMHLASLGMELKSTSGKTFELRTNKRLPHLPYAKGARSCHIMPERIAVPDISKPFRQAIGGGTYEFLANQWDSGAHVTDARNDTYGPRQKKPDVLSGGKATHFDRVEWKILMAAGDIPINTAVGQMTAELYKRIGLNVVYTSVECGMLLARVQNPDPPSEWASFCSGWAGLSTANPGANRPLAGNVPNPQMEAFRAALLEASDVASQKRIAEEIRVLAAQMPHSVPMGQYFLPHARKPELNGFSPAAIMPFWGVRRG